MRGIIAAAFVAHSTGVPVRPLTDPDTGDLLTDPDTGDLLLEPEED